MRVLALAAAAKQIYKRRIAVLDERIEAVKASMAARRKQAIAMAAAVVAAGEAATEPRRHVRRALGKWRGSTVGVYLADGYGLRITRNGKTGAVITVFYSVITLQL